MKNIIYMDNAATTPVASEVLEAMLPYYKEKYFNPSSTYMPSQELREEIEKARKTIAQSINADIKEIFFTGCGTEADNWALKGTALALKEKGKHIITTKIEHHAILHSCEALKKLGFDITYLDVDEDGLVSPLEVEKAIRPDTILVSVMFANNEIGTIEPIREIGEVVHKHGVLFHTDAVQAFGHVDIDVIRDNIDMLSTSAHKLNAPKGIGFLYKKKTVNLVNFMDGGSQEMKRRAGTENVAGIIGFAKAVEIAKSHMEERRVKETNIRDHIIDRILNEIEYTKLNGHRTKRLPNNVNISFRFIEGESMLLSLAAKGICASSGSACTSGSLDPSHVLLAIGLPHEIAHGSLRATIDHNTTMEEADYLVDSLKEIVARLRNMSPLYEDFVKNNM